MTNFTSKQVSCVVCNQFSGQDVLLSTNSFGGSDLDLRPPPMKRDTMSTWLQRCDHCGYVSYDISELIESEDGKKLNIDEIKAIIESDEYEEQLHCNTLSRLTNTFLCYSIMQEKGFQNYPATGWACLRAAWVCDDGVKHDAFNAEKHKANAVKCRQRAIKWFLKCRELGITFVQQTGTEEMILSDLYRRCRMFEESLGECDRAEKKKNSIDDFVWKLIEFERFLVEQEDVECHKVSDAQLSFKKD